MYLELEKMKYQGMNHNKDEIPRGQKSGHRYQEKIF